MNNIYDKFFEKRIFIQNEFYKKYRNLIDSNAQTQYEKYKMNKHHIIPKSVYVINGMIINNTKKNLVVLSIQDHILAHYYLALCVTPVYRHAMENAFFHLINSNKNILPSESELKSRLPEYEKIYNQYCKDLSVLFTHDQKSEAAKLGWKNRRIRGSYLNNRPSSKHQKEIASLTFKGKQKSTEQRKKMSISGKQYHKNHPDAHVGKNNPMFGRKRMHLASDPTISLIVKQEQFQEYLNKGYVFNDKKFNEKFNLKGHQES